MNKKLKPAIIFISILSVVYLLKEFVCLFFAALPGMDQAPVGKEAVWLSESLNRIQMAYFVENQKFATAEDVIQDYTPKFFENHKYSIEVIENSVFSNSMKNNARKDMYIRKHSPVLSKIFGWGNTPTYTVAAGVFYPSAKQDFKDIICISDTPGWQEINKPFLKDGEPVCAEGITKFVVN